MSATLGLDQHDAVRSPHTVQCRRRSILEHRDILDLTDHQILPLGFETVHQYQHAIVVRRLHTPYFQGRAVVTRRSGAFDNQQSGQLPEKRVGEIGGIDARQLIAVDR